MGILHKACYKVTVPCTSEMFVLLCSLLGMGNIGLKIYHNISGIAIMISMTIIQAILFP